MDNLNLPSSLLLIWELKRTIEKNLSLHQGLQKFSLRLLQTKQSKQNHFEKNFIHWWQIRQKTQVCEIEYFNAQHRALIVLIENGLRGQSIYDPLKALEADFIEICDADIQEHAAKLPLLLQIPLIFMVFPAICILLLVPTLYQLSF